MTYSDHAGAATATRPDERSEFSAGPTDSSVGTLIGEVTADLSKLMRQEMALAKAEMKEEAVKTGKAAGMLGGAGFAGYMTIFFASIALWWGLANVMDEGWAALIVTALWGATATVLAMLGRKQLAQVRPKPEQTLETLKEVPAALKGR
ncbi:MAG: phage holin family protein [Sporichthyaceae bacterium]